MCPLHLSPQTSTHEGNFWGVAQRHFSQARPVWNFNRQPSPGPTFPTTAGTTHRRNRNSASIRRIKKKHGCVWSWHGLPSYESVGQLKKLFNHLTFSDYNWHYLGLIILFSNVQFWYLYCASGYIYWVMEKIIRK